MITMVVIMMMYLMLSVLVAFWAASRGRNFRTVFFISVAITPLFIIGSFWSPRRERKSPLLK